MNPRYLAYLTGTPVRYTRIQRPCLELRKCLTYHEQCKANPVLDEISCIYFPQRLKKQYTIYEVGAQDAVGVNPTYTPTISVKTEGNFQRELSGSMVQVAKWSE